MCLQEDCRAFSACDVYLCKLTWQQSRPGTTGGKPCLLSLYFSVALLTSHQGLFKAKSEPSAQTGSKKKEEEGFWWFTLQANQLTSSATHASSSSRDVSPTSSLTEPALSVAAGIIRPCGRLHSEGFLPDWTAVLLKESSAAGHELTFTTNACVRHLRTETYLCSDPWSISLWNPCFQFPPFTPLFNLFLLLYLIAYFPPVVSPRLCLSLLAFLGFLPTSLLPNWISCRWSIWRGRGRATTAWEKHRLSSGRSTRGGTCCSPDSRCRSLLLLLLLLLLLTNRLWHLWWALLMHSRDNNRLVSSYYLISLLLYDSGQNGQNTTTFWKHSDWHFSFSSHIPDRKSD